MASLDFVDLTESSPPATPNLTSRAYPSAIPHRDADHDNHESRRYILENYIREHWEDVDEATRNRANAILLRLGLRTHREQPSYDYLSKTSMPRLKDAYKAVYQYKHHGRTTPQPRHNSASRRPITSHPTPAPSRPLSQASISQRPHQNSRIQNLVPRPDDVRNIIMSSDSMAIRNVLVELCKSSPALSRATVRCLAPNSSFAQATIRRAKQQAQPSASRQSPNLSRAVPQESVVKRERPGSTVSPINVKREGPSTTPNPLLRAALAESSRSVKRETLPLSWNIRSHSVDSSSEASSPASSPQSGDRRMPGAWDTPEPSDRKRKHEGPLICERCSQEIDAYSCQSCRFHPLDYGILDRGTNNGARFGWSCCGADAGDLGCAVDSHLLYDANGNKVESTPSR